jgi:hypothetical protein
MSYKTFTYKIIIIIGLCFATGPMTSYTQEFHTLYWMQGIPQASYANPALQPNPNYYVGIPGISALYTGFTNTGFAPKDIFRKDSSGRLYIDDQNLISSLAERNFLITDVSNDWIAFGFRAKKVNYFSFNITERVETRLGFAKDLVRLAIEGNDPFLQEETAANLDGFSFDVNHFREFGIGYSRKLNDKLIIGVRAKALQGLGNINFSKTNLSLNTGPNNYELLLNADLLINTSLPVQLAPLDSLASFDPEFDETDAVEYVTNFGNMGFAVDLGGVYHLNEKFSFAMSIKDLGFIGWKSNVENFTATGELEFKGLDFENLFINNDEDETQDDSPMGDFLDSIINLLDRKETMNAYNLMTTPKFFVSAAFNLTKMHKFALLGKGELYGGTLYPSVTASYNFQPINRFGSTFSYSIIHGSFHNVGFGVHVNIYPLQIYVVTDNFLWAMRPHTIQKFNLQIGVNIAAGWTKEDLSAPRFRW